MLVWSGRGYLSIVVLLISVVILMKLLPEAHQNFGISIAFFITALGSWLMGKKWNNVEGRTMVDKATGEEIIFKNKHSLFWIRMEYWAYIFSALGVALLVKELV